MGHIGCLSFYPTKNLGGFGDGGMLTTSDDVLAKRLRQLRNHGMNPRYYHHEIGINSRLDTLQAAVLQIKLPYLDCWTSARSRHAARYRHLFEAAGLSAEFCQLPAAEPGRVHVWNQFTIRIPGGNRDALRSYLSEHKIGTEVYYPVPLHQQQCFAYLGYKKGRLPETERAASEVLSLPVFPELTADEQELVVEKIAEFFEG
jgi:dTDP-4-amino-4,6-dideoxygalactose transaminase